MKFRFSVGNIGRLIVFCVSILAFASSSLAQITFNNFSNTSGLQFNGIAAQAGSVLRLTPIGPGVQAQAGSAWFTTPQSIAGGFTSTFTFQLTPGQPGPADGIAFVIQNAPTSPLTALGGTGGAMGYGQGPDSSGNAVNGLQNSLAIEFDSYVNAWDPDGNHVAVQSCPYNYQQAGSPNVPAGSNNEFHESVDANFNPVFEGTVAFTPCTLSYNDGKALISLFPPNPAINLADGASHTVTVDYEACGNTDCSPTLHVSIDNQDLFPGGIFVNLSTQLQLSSGTAYVGFTGGTGSFTENGDILSWTFTPHSSTTITLPTPPGVTTVFPFGAFNFKSTPSIFTKNGNVLSVTAMSVPAGTGVNFTSGQGATCIPYANAGNTCWTFELVCTGPDCGGTYDAEFSTSYDLASGMTISAPGFGKNHNDVCALNGNVLVGTFSNQIDNFFVQRIDPTTKARSGGTGSCWVATQNTPGVKTVVNNFIGFNSPVNNATVNLVNDDRPVPLNFSVLSQTSVPISNLTLCRRLDSSKCAAGTLQILVYPSTCSVDANVALGPAMLANFGFFGLRNLGGGSYQFNWIPFSEGPACRTVVVNLLDGINHSAVFGFLPESQERER